MTEILTAEEIASNVNRVLDTPSTRFEVFYHNKYVKSLSNEEIAEIMRCSKEEVAEMEADYLRRLRSNDEQVN
ncbi:hypothetical protein Q9L42_021150 (plasmid) [Methylomarinum sp. Ch1-1]|uniref:RNA polymerase sigma-70 region 4 domain-containing protein n=1 Tax=Methylomarinum roseum TaxID=3067653 RepID=A0AAU7P0K2_9GAMM|nr:hypothetical protein [Methylomarinum sp. Ch1-1]MDP4523164.1 hypothetical protein [Methylomarinum sp. Ch1-1]